VFLTFYLSSGVTTLVAIHLSLGTSLFVLVFSALASSYEYHRNGHVIWRAVVPIGAGGVVGALTGSLVAGSLDAHALQKLFAFATLIAAIQLFAGLRKPKGEQKPNLAAPGLAGFGLLIGVVSSLTGVGGGLFSVPMMYSTHRFPLMKALGTTSATIVITATAAVIGYAVSGKGNLFLPAGTLGYIAPLNAVPAILGIVPCGILGMRIAQRMKTNVPQKVFAVFLLVVAVRLMIL